MQVLSPTSLHEALAMLSDADTPLMPVAGGTDLLVSWHHQVKDDWKLLDLSHLSAELQPLRLTDDSLEIGALTTYWDVMSSPSVAAAFPLLAQAARQVGAIQIQTRGTWAGNIANGSPAADGVPVMMAYSATVVLESADGVTEVPLDRYYTGYKQSVRQPDQLIRAIRLPRRTRQAEWFHKVGSRSAQAITKVGVAMVKDTHGWRVIANSVAPTVVRCRTLEAALDARQTFRSPDEIATMLNADISPIDDLRSTTRYRETVLSRLIYFRLDEREKRKEKREK